MNCIIGKDLLTENPDFLFKYKNEVPVGIMGMVDDTICISEIGHKAQQMNAYFNVRAAEKKLQFSELKCHKMTIHKSKKYIPCSHLKVDIWKKSYDEKDILNETFKSDYNLENVKQNRYLVCILFNEGTNTKHIKSRANKLI